MYVHISLVGLRNVCFSFVIRNFFHKQHFYKQHQAEIGKKSRKT